MDYYLRIRGTARSCQRPDRTYVAAMPALASNFKTEISTLLANKEFVPLKAKLANWLPADVAPILSELPIEELAVLFRGCTKELAAAVFSYLEHNAKHKLLKTLTQPQAAALLNELPSDDRTTFLNALPLDLAMQLISLLTPEERKITQDLLAYPEHSVGRMMTLDYVAVHREWTVRESLDYIREHGYDRETLSMIYVTDEEGILLDDIRVRRFLLANPETKVSALMDGNYATLAPADDREKALQVFRKYDRVALPVTNADSKLIGIVTADDMLDVASEEATEDIQKLGGSEALDEPYVTIALHRMVKKRASWLVILFLGEMFTATAMGYFDDEIKKAAILANFMPLVISAGGNSGSQAATLVIRALALGEFKLREWWKIMRREFVVGSVLGLILGTVGFLRIALWSAFSNVYGPHWVLIGATVGVSLVGIVLWGSMMGSMLPLIIKKCGLDPASSSAPFIATLVDVTGLIIYFTVAVMILRGTVL